MSKAAGMKAAAGAARPARGGWKWWHGMAAGMLLMLSPGAVLLCAALLAPALLVFAADTSPGRALTRTVILFSLAGALEPIREIVTGDHDLAAALHILTQPRTVPLAWLFAGCGWLVNETSCLVAGFTATRKLAARRRALEALLLEIRTEWQIPAPSEPARDIGPSGKQGLSPS